MAFSDNSAGRQVIRGEQAVQITLAEACLGGDLLGYSSGWKKADANNTIYAELIAGRSGSIGAVIPVYRLAHLGGFSGGTAGAVLYLSDTAGGYSDSAGTVSQRVGVMVTATEAMVEPKAVVLTKANAVDWDDIEAMSGDITISSAGVTTIGANKVLGSMLDVPSSDGLQAFRVARATYDFDEHGGTIAAHGLGVTLPDDAVVCGGFVDVKTTCESATDAGTMAIHVQGANDIVTATAISAGGDIWDVGLHPIIPKANTPETTGIKLTAAHEITATIAVEAFTAGKFTVFIYYTVGD